MYNPVFDEEKDYSLKEKDILFLIRKKKKKHNNEIEPGLTEDEIVEIISNRVVEHLIKYFNEIIKNTENKSEK